MRFTRHSIAPMVFLLGAFLTLPCPIEARQPPIKTRDDGPYEPLKNVVPTPKAIEQFKARVQLDPRDHLSWNVLAALYLRNARENGDLSNYENAEKAARKSLEILPSYSAAQATVAQVMLGQHKFREGLALARKLSGESPREVQFLGLIGDAELELGNYESAEKAYRDLQAADKRDRMNSRLGRLAELRGNLPKAIEHFRKAAEVEGVHTVTPASRAWFPMRLGEVHFQAGQYAEAAAQFQAALKDHPTYHAALTGLGRVRAAEGKLDEAIALYKQAVNHNADLAAVAELGDLYAKTGLAFLAQLNYDKVEQAGAKTDAFARELAHFYANHDRKLTEAVALAQKDLEVRQDIYAHDALAWALCKNGQFGEANKAMQQALKLGTQDASLFYHAGMIQKGLGDKAKARDFLARALKLNPGFSLLQAEAARKALAELN